MVLSTIINRRVGGDSWIGMGICRKTESLVVLYTKRGFLTGLGSIWGSFSWKNCSLNSHITQTTEYLCHLEDVHQDLMNFKVGIRVGRATRVIVSSRISNRSLVIRLFWYVIEPGGPSMWAWRTALFLNELTLADRQRDDYDGQRRNLDGTKRMKLWVNLC